MKKFFSTLVVMLSVIGSLGLVSDASAGGRLTRGTALVNAVNVRHASGARALVNAMNVRHASGGRAIVNSVNYRHASGGKAAVNARLDRHNRIHSISAQAKSPILNLNR